MAELKHSSAHADPAGIEEEEEEEDVYQPAPALKAPYYPNPIRQMANYKINISLISCRHLTVTTIGSP